MAPRSTTRKSLSKNPPNTQTVKTPNSNPGSRTQLPVDLVFDGGAMHGIALVGALSVLESEGYCWRNLAGTSAGAIVASLSAAGYKAAELHDLLTQTPFSSFLDDGWGGHLKYLHAPLSILHDLGIYKGDALLQQLRVWLENKHVVTFKDLQNTDFANDPNPLYHYKVQVIVSDITANRLLVLPRDAHFLGVEPDQLNVALAVRMSASIPLFFDPVRFTDPSSGNKHILVDGGLLSDFPLWLFDTTGTPPWPTFGLQLVDQNPSTQVDAAAPLAPDGGIPMVVSFIEDLVSTMLKARDRMYIEDANFARTIPIQTLGLPATNFHLSPDQIAALYQAGCIAARKFLDSWDFQAYIDEFRSVKPTTTSRRSRLIDSMRQGTKL